MQNSNKNFSSKLIFSSMIILLALLLTSTLALAQSGTRLYLQPVESAADVLTVDVITENVTDLYTLEVHLKYDPTVLAAQDTKTDQEGVQIEAGSLLPVSQGFVVANQVNEAEGKIAFAMTLLNPAPAVSGSGPVARITFKVLQDVPSAITVEQATLVSVNLQPIPHQTAPLAIGAETQIVTAAPAAAPVADVPIAPPAADDSGFPWWIVAAVVLVAGILAMGVLIVMVNFNKRQPKVAVEHQAIAEKPGRVIKGRPSAFKEQALRGPQQPRQ
jgi:hypothetical protein